MGANGQETGGGGLPEYQAIDPLVHVGQVPLAYCVQVQESASEHQGPEARLDSAWVSLETSLAMTRELNPQTEEPFTRKELAAAKQDAQVGFRTILRDEELPLVTRVSAGVGLASVNMQHEMATRHPFQPGNMSFVYYLQGLQKASQLLLQKGEYTPEEDHALRVITSIALLTEYAEKNAWFLPASTRQFWDINAINRKHQKLARLAIVDEADSVPKWVVAMPPTITGDHLWANEGDPTEPHNTLKVYNTLEPGFGRISLRTRKPIRGFDAIASSYLTLMNDHEYEAPSPVIPEMAGSIDVSDKQRPELAWYLAQSSGDFRDLSATTLRSQLLNLEDAYTKGELTYFEQHTMGWMQFDYGRILIQQMHKKRAEAQAAWTRERQVSRYDAPPFAEAAQKAEAEADTLMHAAAAYFDSAEAVLTNAADTAAKTHLGESFEMHLNAQAMAVYKVLYTEAGPEAIDNAVTAYARRLITLYEPMRLAERKLGRNPNQREALQVTALKAGISLLILHSSDEMARDLALPAPPRAGGKQGEIDLVVFPFNSIEGGYDVDSPVNMQLQSGAEISYKKGHVDIGINRLIRNADRLAFHARLVAAARATAKTKGNKKRLRSEALDEITYEITNAIADAAEAS